MLINDAPKYGNDIDEVDQLVVDVYNIYIDEMKNIQILVMEEVNRWDSLSLVLQVFLPTLDKVMAQWLLQTEEKHIHLLLRMFTAHAMDKKDQLLCLNLFLNYQHMKLLVVFY